MVGLGRPLVLEELLHLLLPGALERSDPPRWPPDAFALAATSLQRADAYTEVVRDWPPDNRDWSIEVRRLAKRWRAAALSERPLPRELRSAWAAVRRYKGIELARLREERALWQALVRLLAAADEASVGIGLPVDRPDEIDQHALRLLHYRLPASLGKEVHPSRTIVLPKLHAPRNGITLRSLTHHLCLCQAGEVTTSWLTLPTARHKEEVRDASRRLGLLLLPWPTAIRPTDFSQSRHHLRNLAPPFGHFTCSLPRRSLRASLQQAEQLVRAAQSTAGPIDGVVLPELAVPPGFAAELCHRTGLFVVNGVAAREKQADINCLEAAFPLQDGSIGYSKQGKQHRWRLDRTQIEQYGLAGVLDSGKEWWESFPIGKREITFWSAERWLTLCALICEDLARPDPAGDILRAVGPHLVLALLRDGPQLGTRWSGRHATVLADDPGSSVLTLTSLGMALRSRLPNQPPSRVIALWKDPYTGLKEISLPEYAEAVVLRLKVENHEEWTADGRGDDKQTYYLLWDGCVDVSRGSRGRRA